MKMANVVVGFCFLRGMIKSKFDWSLEHKPILNNSAPSDYSLI